MSVLLETSAGDLVIDLLVDEAPKACLNFLKLCKSKYYNFSPVYNIQNPSFFQSGDPLFPDGDGGSSCWGLTDSSKKYFIPEQTKRNHGRGAVSMVCSSTGLAGSQFFVSLDANESFDRKHTVFGRLAEGFETLDTIATQPVDKDFRSLRDIRINHTIILEDPFDDPPEFIGEPPESPLPSQAQLNTIRIAFDEELDNIQSLDEIEAGKRTREAEANALTLETLGDLPFASIRPPENILFVCKLNSVTSSDDLSLIFGRFGKILSCQVVRDRRTGDSLQYAFIEFDIKENAERAYFKMQGVLIDDRRIHVDFSQSVAKTSVSEISSIGQSREQSKSLSSSHAQGRARQDRNSRYDMLFEDGTTTERQRLRSRSPDREARHRRHRSIRDRDSNTRASYDRSRTERRRSRSRDRSR